MVKCKLCPDHFSAVRQHQRNRVGGGRKGRVVAVRVGWWGGWGEEGSWGEAMRVGQWGGWGKAGRGEGGAVGRVWESRREGGVKFGSGGWHKEHIKQPSIHYPEYSRKSTKLLLASKLYI